MAEDKKKDAEVTAVKVEVVNKEKKVVSDYDSREDMEYDELGITTEEIEEFENDKS